MNNHTKMKNVTSVPRSFWRESKPAGLKGSRWVKEGPGKGGRPGEAPTGGSRGNEGCGGDRETREQQRRCWDGKPSQGTAGDDT